jgi:mycothiol synthase
MPPHPSTGTPPSTSSHCSTSLPDAGNPTADPAGWRSGAVVGGAIVGGGELDLVVVPEHRGRGYGGAAAAALLIGPVGDGDLTAWSHGNFPAARALARRHGFEAIRTLLQLRLDPDWIRRSLP